MKDILASDDDTRSFMYPIAPKDVEVAVGESEQSEQSTTPPNSLSGASSRAGQEEQNTEATSVNAGNARVGFVAVDGLQTSSRRSLPATGFAAVDELQPSARRSLDVNHVSLRAEVAHQKEFDFVAAVTQCASNKANVEASAEAPAPSEAKLPVVVGLEALHTKSRLRRSFGPSSSCKLAVDTTHRDDFKEEQHQSAEPSVAVPPRQISETTRRKSCIGASAKSYKRSARCAPPGYVSPEKTPSRPKRRSLAEILGSGGPPRLETQRKNAALATSKFKPGSEMRPPAGQRRRSLVKFVEGLRARKPEVNHRGDPIATSHTPESPPMQSMGQIISELRRSMGRARV